MAINIKSLQARLFNLAKERNESFQLLLNRFGAEQFLYRLSISPQANQFIFKGGSLLTYLIDSNRRTRDLDFSIKKITIELPQVTKVVESILQIAVDDGLKWKEVVGEVLRHPDIEDSGARIHCHFLLGEMKGSVHIDVALDENADTLKFDLQRMLYKGEPLFPEKLLLTVYSPEAIFSEKLCTSINKGAQNTRMKDYYDLYRLSNHSLDADKLKNCIATTFKIRKTAINSRLEFNEIELTQLETYWNRFLNKDRLDGAPDSISEVVITINHYLENLFKNKSA